MSVTQMIIEQTERYSANNYHPLPVVMAVGKGVWLLDVHGRGYLDMFSAYSAQNFGQCHPSIVSVAVDQISRLGTTSRAVYTDVYANFVKAIDELCSMDKILPASGGAEAVETAIKLARKWGYEKKLDKKAILNNSAHIIFCDNNFHGRTISIISGSDSPENKNGFGPFTPGFTHVPFGDPDALGRAITKNTVGFLVEPIQGEGGIIVPPDGYFKEVQKICRNYGVLLIMDEIQTGFGRTGRNFAYEYEDVRPDILILGKALGGGVLPVSAVLSHRAIMEVIRPGEHGSTFGGNPLACAVGIAAIELLVERNFPLRASSLGQYFMSELRSIKSPLIREVRGRGLMIGLELVPEPGIGRRFSEAMLKEGILCKETKDNVIRFAPPLIIEKKELDWALEKIKMVLRGIEERRL